MGSLCMAVLWARDWLVTTRQGYLTHSGLSEIKEGRFSENTFITPVYRPDRVEPQGPHRERQVGEMSWKPVKVLSGKETYLNLYCPKQQPPVPVPMEGLK